MTRSFGVYFDLLLNKRLSKQWWGWWFETPSRSLWRHCKTMSYACWCNPIGPITHPGVSIRIQCLFSITHFHFNWYSTKSANLQAKSNEVTAYAFLEINKNTHYLQRGWFMNRRSSINRIWVVALRDEDANNLWQWAVVMLCGRAH